MGDYEASTTVDVASTVLFEYLSDVERLPEYLPQMTEAHRAGEVAEGERVEVEAVIQPEGEPERKVEGEAWIDVVEDGKKLRWGAPGPHEYHGELDVDFVADGTSKLTVRLHTEHADGSSIEDGLRHTLAGIKSAAERKAANPSTGPDA
ncbi:SRPBCC family protein [Kribbella sancticallisti]|uniref:SRPBCC family protein n=1 Tax=Kribbella sancticallisti TaxID=460087 RepID=A0ABN2DIK2_9ACTN